MNNSRFIHARKMLAGSMLIMGACGIAYEYTLGALGNNLMGSSHEQIFVVIGLMMFAMGIGATLQKNIAGNLITKFLLLEIILGLTGGVSALLIYFSYVFSSSYMLLLWGFSLGIGYKFKSNSIDLSFEKYNKQYKHQLYDAGLTNQASIDNNNTIIKLSISSIL